MRLILILSFLNKHKIKKILKNVLLQHFIPGSIPQVSEFWRRQTPWPTALTAVQQTLCVSVNGAPKQIQTVPFGILHWKALIWSHTALICNSREQQKLPCWDVGGVQPVTLYQRASLWILLSSPLLFAIFSICCETMQRKTLFCLVDKVLSDIYCMDSTRTL